ncbi:MAG: helix-turn-helix domain-containing protein [Mariprofundaceae bacterium]|nr:helix-turn-helix domain-containing protein [Mariprofundaceae bacterium]
MDIKKAIELAGGRQAVSEKCGVTNQAIQLWLSNGRLPLSEITGKSNHARVIAEMAAGNGHNIDPIDLCPGALQYMQQPDSEAA